MLCQAIDWVILKLFQYPTQPDHIEWACKKVECFYPSDWLWGGEESFTVSSQQGVPAEHDRHDRHTWHEADGAQRR